jgi:hypothetical protein
MSDNGHCTCAELNRWPDGEPVPKWHRCEYVRARNSLIPKAVKIADQRVPNGHSADGGARWTRVYVETLDELCDALAFDWSGR